MSQNRKNPGVFSYRLFAFSGLFWILSAWLSQTNNRFPQTLSFTGPGVLSTPPSLWLKADAGVTVNTGGVSYWRDQSGHSHHAYQPKPDYRPERLDGYLNFNPVLDFDGADEFIYGSAGFSTQTYFIVAYNDEQIGPTDEGQTLLNFGANGNNYLGLGSMTSYLTNEFISFGIIQDTVYRSGLAGNGYITAGPHLFGSWRNQGASGPRQMIQVNGRTTVNVEYNPAGYAWVDDEEYVVGGKLNSDGSVRNLLNGKIAEVIAFDASLGKFDRAKVQSYLALKYGLTLNQSQSDLDLRAYYDANANVIWNPTRQPGFNKDIAGIGKDDRSGLYQPRSKSANEGTFVTIGSPSDLSQGEFLIWANDGGEMNFLPDDAPAGYRRLERRWRVQETGDVGAVDISGLGSHLVIDREGNGFADNPPVPIGTAVNLNDGDVFTFLVADIELCGAPGGVSDGLSTWLRADAGVSTTGSGAVNYWEDYSGNNHYLTQSDPGRRPTWSAEALNFNPTVVFNENLNQLLEGPAGGFSTHDYFLVFAPNDEIYAGGDGVTLIGAEQAGERFDFGYNAFTTALANELLFHSVGLGYTYSSGLASDQRIIDSFFPYIANPKDNAAGDDTEIYFNGVPVNNAGSGAFTSLENARFSLGSSITGSRPYHGKIAELIVYDSRNSSTARRRIQSYLALKYGVTLDQSAADWPDRHYYNSAGTVVWNAQRNQNYANDIAGIGRDAGSCLVQPLSQSQHPDGILRIGRASNLDDGEFLIWGNNAAPVTESGEAGAPAGFYTLNRVWRAQETGDVGKVEISFAKGALGKSNGAGYFLVVDTDNNASFADETPRPFSFDGKRFRIADAELNDGNRFTIAVNCSGVTVDRAPIREEYYLPIPEDQLLDVLQTIYPSAAACNRAITAREPRAPVFNYTSITTQGQGTVIVYDHWEDGFESDLERPQQPSTEIWGDANPANGYPPGFPCDIILADAIVLDETFDPDNRGGVLYYDGGDRVGSSGPVAITKANWSEGGRTLFAGAVEVFATEFWSNSYIVPFGENVPTSTQSFEYVGALIMAREDNTIVTIDRNGDGTPEETATLNQGQSRLVNGGLNTGALINASAPVQVQVATGDICDNFESRWFALPGNDVTCDAYFSAVADNSVMYYFYNPNSTSILIKHRTALGPQSDFLVPAKGYVTKFFGTPDQAGHHFYTENGRNFYAAFLYSMNDYTGRGSAFDWGATLICEDLLPRSLQLGWAYGQDPTLPPFENGSPIWLTAAYPTGSESSGPIQVCVDYNGDNAGPLSDGEGRNFDLLLNLDPYEAVRLFDPDGDQTGTIISVCDGSDALLAVHWGPDQDAASAGEPGLDLGTGIPFNLPYYVDKLVAGRDGDDAYLAGEEIVYTIEILPLGQNIVGGPFLIKDMLPPGLSYLPGTAEVVRPDGAVLPLTDDAAGQTPFPFDENGRMIGASTLIHPGQKLSVRFAARIDAAAQGKVVNEATVVQGVYERSDEVAFEVTGRVKTFDLALVKRVAAERTPPPYLPGRPVSFEIEVFNQGEVDAYNVEITDYLPAGLTLDDGDWAAANGKAVRVIPGPIPPGGSQKVVIDLLVAEDAVGTIDNFAEISGADNDRDPGNAPPSDQDSAYDQNPADDAGGLPDSPADNATGGNGQGTPGSGDAATDADDHDGARIQVQGLFDLALTKTLSPQTPGPFAPGDLVVFRLELFNQGTLAAQNIQLNEYLPAGLTLADAAWTEVVPGRAQLNVPIPSLPAGARISVDARFRIDAGFQGVILLNRAEIAGATNAQGRPDRDSQPDNDPHNDAPAEDDHDEAEIAVGQTFDLALTKTLSSQTPGPFVPGDLVVFRLDLLNQGTLDAQNIQLNEYIPAGLILDDPAWTEIVPGRAQLNAPLPNLPAGGQTSVDARFRIDVGFQGANLLNRAEIAGATNAQGQPDRDSRPDNNPDNDAAGEDDHDSERIVVGQVFDLALVKKLNAEVTPGPFRAGDPVRFTIEVINQGTRDAARVEVSDYLPAGLLLADDEWTLDGGRAVYIHDGPLPANGGSAIIEIDLIVAADFAGTSLLNRAEISAADDDGDPGNAPPIDIDSRYDTDPGNDAGGAPGSLADDAVDGNGQGAVGGADPATDEDDADVALLALCSAADAGADGGAEICTGCGPEAAFVDLWAALGGSPDEGGRWTDLSASGVDLQDPRRVDFAGVEPGAYAFEYGFDQEAGCNAVAAVVTVTVDSYAAVACNNRVNLSFGDNCSIQVTPDLVLEGDIPCPAEYEVRLYDEAGRFLGDVVTGEQAGQIITAEVYNLTCGTSCSGELRIDDQVAPEVVCPAATVDLVCSDADSLLNNPASLAVTGEPDVLDNCSNTYDIRFADQATVDGDCGLVSIARRFTVADPSGNETTCLQLINVRKAGFGDVTFPAANVDLNCETPVETDQNGHPHPSATGFPVVNTHFGTFPLNQAYCNLGASYSDSEPIIQCAGSYTVVRTWTLVDWCATGNATRDYTQLINVEDRTPPVVSCPTGSADTLQFSTGPFNCTATFNVPAPRVSDNCSDWKVDVEVVTDEARLVYDRFGRVVDTVLETRTLAVLPAGSPVRYVTGIPTGLHRFRYTVQDACGNVAIKECPFRVSDRIEPVAVCDNRLTISLGGGGVGRLTAGDLDEGSWDNCGLVSSSIRRAVLRNENCTAVAETFTDWTDALFFNCCDIGLENRVELLVIDRSGNRNVCRATVMVEDRIGPTCVAPAPAGVSCHELPPGFDPGDPADLQALFGGPQVVDNCGGGTWEELAPVVDLSDCGAGTVSRAFRARDDQGNYSANSCRQVVTIAPYHEYEIQFPADVSGGCGEETAPAALVNAIGCDDLGVNVYDETFTDIPGICSRTLRRYRVINWCAYDGESDPVIIGRDEDCDGVGGDEPVWVLHRNGATYVDRDNDESNGLPGAAQRPNCPPDNPAGYWRTVASVGFWQYTQHIDVVEETATRIQQEATPAFCHSSDDCSATVVLPFTVESDCDRLTFRIYLDEQNDGSVDRELPAAGAIAGVFPAYTLTAVLPIGDHAVELELEDGCGKVTTARFPCAVVDCTAPAPVCLTEASVDLEPQEEGVDADGDGDVDLGAVRVEATSLLAGETVDCSGPVRYSIHYDWQTPDPSQTALVLTCDAADTVRLRLYAWDAADNPFAEQPDGRMGGPNYGFCEVVVSVKDDLFESCLLKAPGRVSGLIMTEIGNAVEDVSVKMSGPVRQDYATDFTGAYLFENLEEGYDYTIKPDLNLNHRNGVTTFDLTIIEKHILGTKKIESPYNLIAADANRSGNVSVFDVIKIRQLILGEIDEFPENTSWRFVRADHVFPDPANPFATWIPEVITINDLYGLFRNGDFVGIKVGDVNHTAIANSKMGVAPRAPADTLYFTLDDRPLRAGETYRIPVFLPEVEAVEGYQYTLAAELDRLELLGVEPGLARAWNFGRRFLSEGLLTTSWHRTASTAEDPSNPMFTLTIRAKADIMLSEALQVGSRVTPAEAYGSVGETRAVGLAFRPSGHWSAQPRLDQNRPNPFAGETVIGYALPVDTGIRLVVYDVHGRQVYVETGRRAAGEHQVRLDRRPFAQGGVYYYTLTTDDGFRATRKMVWLGSGYD